jgi:hypothetical protein
MFRPDHIYIPGVNERHPENTFETIRITAMPDSSIEELANCDAFKHGIFYLEEGYFWEAHEVFEPVWMALPHDSEERRFVQGLIQLANASLKAEMARPKAVCRLCRIARELLISTNGRGAMMNLEHKVFLRQVDALETRINLSL